LTYENKTFKKKKKKQRKGRKKKIKKEPIISAAGLLAWPFAALEATPWRIVPILKSANETQNFHPWIGYGFFKILQYALKTCSSDGTPLNLLFLFIYFFGNTFEKRKKKEKKKYHKMVQVE